MKTFSSYTQKIGKIGEEIACRFLEKKSFRIVEKNYTRQWGEIDIIGEKKSKFYFIEVKTIISSSEKNFFTNFKPEENFHYLKQMRVLRAIKSYLNENKNIKEWQFNLICVFLDLKAKKSLIKCYPSSCFLTN